MDIESDIAVLETAMFGTELYPHMRASIPQRATEAAGSHTYGCPLCNCGADSEDDIYCHLLVSHRKSALVAALLERVDSDE
ncbi:hypothetical protein Har1130_13245 [Haloarcula sp. CBA1130]|nr:hypothetical protein Har1129_13345 [Haloarcula sp. CBA1129]KAA9403677.1 hypothetical protein Har1130_13245 [Haloarcula sp. CBA1130]